MAQALDRPQPQRPHRIDGDIEAAHLSKEARVAQPRHPDLLRRGHRQVAVMAARLPRGEDRRDEHLIEEIHVPLLPALHGAQADFVFALTQHTPPETEPPGRAARGGWGGERIVDHGGEYPLTAENYGEAP
jgi:hypothetical protein